MGSTANSIETFSLTLNSEIDIDYVFQSTPGVPKAPMNDPDGALPSLGMLVTTTFGTLTWIQTPKPTPCAPDCGKTLIHRLTLFFDSLRFVVCFFLTLKILVKISLALLLSMTTWFSASAVIGELLPLYNVSASTGSLLTIAVQVGFLVGSVGSAVTTLSDIIPPRTLIFCGSIGAAATNACLLFGGDLGFGGAVMVRAATGGFLAFVYPPSMKLVSTWFRAKRGMALGVMVSGLTLGSAFPHLVTGLGGSDWRLVVWATSGLTLLGGSCIYFGVEDGPYPFPKSVFSWKASADVFRNRGVRLAMFGYFGHMWELYACWTWFSVFFAHAIRETGATITEDDIKSAAAYMTFVVIGVGAVGAWLGGVASDRWGRSMSTAVIMLVSGTCALLVGLTIGGPLWLTGIVSLIWGVSVIADSAQFSAIVTEVADQAYVGTAVTLQVALGFSLTVLTIWLIPALTDIWTFRWAFAILAIGPYIGAAVMLYLRSLPEAKKIGGGKG